MPHRRSFLRASALNEARLTRLRRPLLVPDDLTATTDRDRDRLNRRGWALNPVGSQGEHAGGRTKPNEKGEHDKRNPARESSSFGPASMHHFNYSTTSSRRDLPTHL